MSFKQLLCLFPRLRVKKEPLSESSFNLEGNLKIGKDMSKGFLTKIYHLYGGLEIRESLADQTRNTVLYLEGEVGLSDGSEFEFIPDISYDISTKGNKAKLSQQSSSFRTESKQNRPLGRPV